MYRLIDEPLVRFWLREAYIRTARLQIEIGGKILIDPGDKHLECRFFEGFFPNQSPACPSGLNIAQDAPHREGRIGSLIVAGSFHTHPHANAAPRPSRGDFQSMRNAAACQGPEHYVIDVYQIYVMFRSETAQTDRFHVVGTVESILSTAEMRIVPIRPRPGH